MLRYAGLTQRRPIGGCFGVASRLLLRSRLTTLLTPTGQKLMLLAKLAYSRRQFSPLRGKSCAFGQTALRRRQFSRSSAAHYLQIVNRFGQAVNLASHNPVPFELTIAHDFSTTFAYASQSFASRRLAKFLNRKS